MVLFLTPPTPLPPFSLKPSFPLSPLSYSTGTLTLATIFNAFLKVRLSLALVQEQVAIGKATVSAILTLKHVHGIRQSDDVREVDVHNAPTLTIVVVSFTGLVISFGGSLLLASGQSLSGLLVMFFGSTILFTTTTLHITKVWKNLNLVRVNLVKLVAMTGTDVSSVTMADDRAGRADVPEHRRTLKLWIKSTFAFALIGFTLGFVVGCAAVQANLAHISEDPLKKATAETWLLPLAVGVTGVGLMTASAVRMHAAAGIPIFTLNLFLTPPSPTHHLHRHPWCHCPTAIATAPQRRRPPPIRVVASGRPDHHRHVHRRVDAQGTSSSSSSSSSVCPETNPVDAQGRKGLRHRL